MELQALQSASETVADMAAQKVRAEHTSPCVQGPLSGCWIDAHASSMAGCLDSSNGACTGALQGWSNALPASGGKRASRAEIAAMPNLRSVGRLLPWADVRHERLTPGKFDLEVEVEQEGGGGSPQLVWRQSDC